MDSKEGSIAPDTSRIFETAPYYSDAPFRLSGQLKDHVLEKIVTSRKTNPTRACRGRCSKGKYSETRYICKSCCVPLHVGDCYTVYHKKKKYSKLNNKSNVLNFIYIILLAHPIMK